MTSTSAQIQETLLQIRSLEKVESHLDDLQQKINLTNNQLNKHQNLMIEKDELVKDLEGMSLKGVFHKILGNKEEQLERKRQDFLEIYLKVEELNKTLSALNFEKGVLEEKRIKNSGLRTQLKTLANRREKELVNSNSMAGQKLIAIAKKADHHNLMVWEIGEAEEAGLAAQKTMDEILHFLQSARNWGRPMSNNNRWNSYRRQTQIDQARKAAHVARQRLYVFQRELADLYSQTPDYAEGLKLDLYEGFLASMFRNMITDFILQQKIVNTIGNVRSVRDAVVLEIHKLSAERNTHRNNLTGLADEKDALLLNS